MRLYRRFVCCIVGICLSLAVPVRGQQRGDEPLVDAGDELARVAPGTSAVNVPNGGYGAAPVSARRPEMISPTPAGGTSIAPARGPDFEARLIWEEKQREADEKGFQWGSAIAQSGVLFGISHAYRLGDQPDTRAELRGPYIKDWVNSVKGLSGWDDTDSNLANYVAHPLSGAITSYFQSQNDPRGRLQEFGTSQVYWKSRFNAFLWATAYSTFYELSPVGDAAIGNVGHPRIDPGTKGAVDLVITPTLGIGLVLLQDLIDIKVVWPLEKRTNSANAIRLLRSLAVPHRSFANLFRFKRPWHVDSRGPAIAPVRYSQLPPRY